MLRHLILPAAGVILVVALATPVEVRQATSGTALVASVDDSPFYAGITDPASLERAVNAQIAESRRLLDQVLAVKAPRTVENTLRPIDEIRGRLNVAVATAGTVGQLHPDASMRSAAEPLVQAVSALGVDLSLNRAVFDALAAMNTAGLPADTRHYVKTSLDNYRRSGVDKDEATRAQVKTLRDQLTEITQAFDRNIREGVRRFQVESNELDGLPADFLAARKPDASGQITLTTEATDQQPVMLYAKSPSLRRRMLAESSNVAYPQNIDVLKRMVATRAAIAKALGYPSWADYDIEDRMAATAGTASDFIDRIVAASGKKAADDYRQLVDRKKRDNPAASSVEAWETGYYTEQVRQTDYKFDSQAVRPYLPYERVRDGVFAVTERLFGLQLTRAQSVPTWHPSVEVFDVLEQGRRVGRVYLDMHPRAGKAGSGASTGTVRNGVAGRQLPEIVLICRFPGGQAGDPGLMTHAQVVTFFHEFGHAVHAISSGRQQWVGLTRINERDFVEAPSQLLEEWANDPAALATFGRHYQTNETIPVELVRQLRRASELGRGLQARGQMVLARLSLSLHDRDPASVDPIALHREFTRRYSPVPVFEENHMPASFTHLANGNYSAAYYTYMWSLVIAKDLFSAFNHSDLLDPARAGAYREAILVPGGSKPARDLVEGYLKRPSSPAEWERWLNGER